MSFNVTAEIKDVPLLWNVEGPEEGYRMAFELQDEMIKNGCQQTCLI